MSQSKSLLAGIFLVGGLAGLVPLFLHDKNNVSISAPESSLIGNSVAEASVKPSTIGKYSGLTLTAANLTSEERMKVYEAEQKVYDAYEDVLTQRYIADFFSKYQKDNKLSDLPTAQNQYFKEKTKVDDAEVKAFLEENKNNPGLQRVPEAERASQVKTYLEGKAKQGQMRQLVDDAKSAGQLKVTMAKPVEPVLEVSDGGNPSMGPKNAKITLVEFADYQCPFCARVVPTIKDLMKKYDGKIRWVYRDFPLKEIHPMSLPAAVVANCAGEQGKYFEMHGKLYDNYAKIGEPLFAEAMAELKLDKAKFDACRKDPKQAAEVDADAEYGQKLGVAGTPSYFINGRKSPGDMREMTRIIDEELAKM